ncbi:MAG: glycosyltransferase family 9 protein [Verrucomicrobia bacterium]|nr:glycosyltransferase family 9 protein [Verrucomicrobiota bacterium]
MTPSRLRPDEIRKIAVMSLTGLGDTLLYRPALRELKKRLPHAEIHAICASRAATVFFESCDEVTRTIQLSQSRNVSPGNGWRLVKGAWALRGERYDLSLTVFPSNRFACALLAILVGARWRLAHHYRSRDHWRNLNGLIHADVPADPNLHDVEQNMTLIEKVTGAPWSSAELDVSFDPAASQIDVAREMFRAWGLDGKHVTGMHVTSFPDMTYKRWEGSRFCELAGRILESPMTGVIIFGTRDERGYIEQVVGDRGDRITVCTDAPFEVVAALVAQCSAFVSNDSGLMHLAVCVGVPTLGIFGPTNPVRTRPWGARHRMVQPDHACLACYRYPFGASPELEKCIAHSCLDALSVAEVYSAYESLREVDG